jgi:hypothetical protein
MKKTSILFRFCFTLVLIGFLASCKKDEETVTPATDADFAKAEASLNLTYETEDLTLWLDQLMNSDRRFAARVSSEAEAIKEGMGCGNMSYTEDEEKGTTTFTLDYGTGVTCGEVAYKGKIRIVRGEATNTISFEDYEQGDRKLSGQYDVTFSEEENGWKRDRVFTSMSYTDARGTLRWNGTRSMRWIGGEEGGRFEITGNLLGTDRGGLTFSSNITAPLVSLSNCDYRFVSGSALVRSERHPDATVNFGEGACDNTFTVTIKGTSRTVTLQAKEVEK